MKTPDINSTDDCRRCWVCLEGGNSIECGELTLPCNCPSLWSHPICIARWQLQQAGNKEETSCRFCQCLLPTWADSLSDKDNRKSQTPMMTVVYCGQAVKLPCHQGAEGMDFFKKQVRQSFNLDESANLDVAFELKLSKLSESQHLSGFQAYEAASIVAASCSTSNSFANDVTQSMYWKQESATFMASSWIVRWIMSVFTGKADLKMMLLRFLVWASQFSGFCPSCTSKATAIPSCLDTSNSKTLVDNSQPRGVHSLGRHAR